MPENRFIHPKLSRSVKVKSLTDFEYRVWTQYILSADDFGVMPATSAQLRADNSYLKSKPDRTVQRGLDRVIETNLIHTFEHQGDRFVFQHDWQFWQRIKYPTTTNLPKPSGLELRVCDDLTWNLFQYHPGGVQVPKFDAETVAALRQSLESSLEGVRSPTVSVDRLTANANGLEREKEGERLDVAFARFRDAYPESRRKGGLLAQQAFMAQVTRAGGSVVLMAALENHKASAQWRNPALVPNMDKWLTEERWRQTLPAEDMPKAKAGGWLA